MEQREYSFRKIARAHFQILSIKRHPLDRVTLEVEIDSAHISGHKTTSIAIFVELFHSERVLRTVIYLFFFFISCLLSNILREKCYHSKISYNDPLSQGSISKIGRFLSRLKHFMYVYRNTSFVLFLFH